METMNVALPKAMKAFVHAQVVKRGYSSVGEYVRDLVRADEKRAYQEKLEGLLLEGLKGKGTPVNDAWWNDFRSRLTERYGRPKRFGSKGHRSAGRRARSRQSD
jgi:antitoxin ParD1/3/4